ncbi:MAG: hypothetical protein ACJAYU_000486 [Bradymonadia bacterium]|jgi:hypothetical protein
MAAPYQIPELMMPPGDAGPALAVMVALTAYLGGLILWYALESIRALRAGQREERPFDPEEMTARFASRNAQRHWRS